MDQPSYDEGGVWGGAREGQEETVPEEVVEEASPPGAGDSHPEGPVHPLNATHNIA